MKIIAADCREENKKVKSCGNDYRRKKQAHLVHHDDRADRYIETAENKKMKCFFQHANTWITGKNSSPDYDDFFRSYGIAYITAFVLYPEFNIQGVWLGLWRIGARYGRRRDSRKDGLVIQHYIYFALGIVRKIGNLVKNIISHGGHRGFINPGLPHI